MTRQTRLTTLEWNVYNTIKENTQKGMWTSMKSLAIKYGVSEREIRRIIMILKDNDNEIHKIILSDHKKGYKLMSNKEEINYLAKRKIHILKMFKRYYKDVKRFNLNNQTKITFGKYERDYFESICSTTAKE